jgi:hypothetical protein
MRSGIPVLLLYYKVVTSILLRLLFIRIPGKAVLRGKLPILLQVYLRYETNNILYFSRIIFCIS